MNQEIKDRVEQIKQGIVPEGYKETEIGIIPVDWEVKKLGKMGKIFRGRGIPKRDITDDGLPCIIYGELYTSYNDVIIELASKTSLEAASNSCQLQYGDILFASSGEVPEEIGKSAMYLNNIPAYAGGDLVILRPNDDIKNEVYGYLLNMDYVRKQKYKQAQGHSVVHLYGDQIKDISIPVIRNQEQQKIADILSTWDRAIELKESLIKEKEEQKKGMVQYLLKPHEKRKWREVKVGDIFTVTRGNVLARKFISNERNSDYKYPVYSSQTKNNGLLGYYKEYLYNDAITWTTDGANAGDTNFRPGKFYCTNVCGVLISDEGYANVCVAEILNSVTKRYVSYVGNPKLMNNVMKDIKIYLPSISEQQRIAKILSTADQEIDLLKREVAKLKEQKKGLMQLLLTGIVRVKEAVTSG